MGKMIDALKLLEQKSPRPMRSAAPEATAIAVEPSTPANQTRRIEPVTGLPAPVLPAPVLPAGEMEIPAAAQQAVLTESPRLRVFSLPEAGSSRQALPDEAAHADFRPEPSRAETTGRQPLRWPKSSAPQQREMDALAARILSQTAPGGPGSLVFTSAGDDCASAALVLGLAPRIAARIDGRLLVVDADAAEAFLSRQLGAGTMQGLTEVSRGEVDWTQLVRETDIERLDVLPARAARNTESGRLDGLDAGRALAEMGMHYAITLIDAGPAARMDAARLGRYCDGVCLAVRLGAAPKALVEEAARGLRLAKAHLLGTIAVS